MECEPFPLNFSPSIVRDFVKIYSEYTEAPDEFLASVPLFIASVLAGSWFKIDHQYLNNYYLLVGPTGTARKTTAQNLAMSLLKEIKDGMPNLVYQLPRDDEDTKAELQGADTAYPLVTHFSIEGLQTRAIGVGTSTAIQIGEYGSLFEVGRRQSQQNTISELTNMYDGNLISVKTLSRLVNAHGYVISIFGASTASWLNDFFSGRNVSGGFVNRHLIFSGIPERILPKPKQPPQKLRDDLVSRFRDLIPNDLQSEVTEGRISWNATRAVTGWSTSAERSWAKYYPNRIRIFRNLTSPIVAELSARELTHAIKLAGLSAFLSRRRIVNDEDLEFGIRLSRWSSRNAMNLVSSSVSYSSTRESDRVMNKLKKSGPISKTDLARALGGNQKEINRAIGHMLVDGILQDCPDGLLRLISETSNSQPNEIEKFFGKTDASEFTLEKKLEVGGLVPPIDFFDVSLNGASEGRSP